MPNGYRLFLGALVAITTLNLVLFLQQRRRGGGEGQNNDGEGGRQAAEIRLLDGLALVPKGMSASNGRSAGSIWSLDPTFRLLAALDDPEHLFLLEPALLAKVVGREEMAELMWRFNLSPTILHRPSSSSSSSVTLGMFADKMSPALGKLDSLEEVARIEGPLPFSSNGTPVLQHLFFRWRDENLAAEDQHQPPLAVHLVLLHPVRHLLWVGQIPQPTIARLRSSSHFTAVLHYGVHEQIFDRFDRLRTLADSVTAVPDDPGHLLSQLPTSRYMHCPPERNQEWLTRHNVSASQHRMYVTEESIGAIKSLMRRLKMEFWAMCGTLLGWHRQCAPIPYTTDNDFSTWPKYLEGPRGGGGRGEGKGSFDMTATLKEAAPGHRLRLLYRFGSHATRSAEYSFATRFNRDKVDLFFTYSNATHFMMPFHVAWKHIFQYSIYPQYSLCSVELLGWKLLAPCTAEEVILAEYGPNWDRPQVKYDYSKAPHNSGPPLPFPRNVSQFSQF